MKRYTATLLDHFQRPRNAGELPAADALGRASFDGSPPYVTVWVKVCEGAVTQATFQAMGCGATIASASILTELIAGRSVEACLQMEEQEVVDALGGIPVDRRFCAIVPLRALKTALVNYLIDRSPKHKVAKPTKEHK